jgi:pantetheine-phosphate adenylyltransferase
MIDAGRVIAGSARGARLSGPGHGTRPLADRVKQTLFAILEPDLAGSRMLDLFAGSGAGGIEALSRGAASATFVERDAGAARIIVENLVRAHLSEKGHVVRADVPAYLADRARSDGPFDIVLIDPPYAEPEMVEATLRRLAANDAALVTSGVWVVAKHFWRTPPPEACGLLASVRTRRFGETGLTFYRRADSALGRGDAVEGPHVGSIESESRGGSQVKIAVYPGSFDPITYGHLDVVSRAAQVFDRVVFAVLINPQKGPPILATDDRLALIRESVRECCPGEVAARIDVESFDGLTVDFCRRRQATFVVRGLRAISDFESELQMAHTNRKLAPEVDTVFFMTALEHSYLSSSLVKEIAAYGGDVSQMVPTAVVRHLAAPARGL